MATADDDFDEHEGWREKLAGPRVLGGLGVAVVLVLTIGYAVIHHDGRSRLFPGFTGYSDAAEATNQSKPSPAIPFGSRAAASNPAPLAPASPEESVVGDPAPAEPVSATEETPTRPLKPRDSEGIYDAKHQKSFGRGCEGKLELSATGIDFTCSSGSEAALHFGVEQIQGANSNGFELKTGEKYHFDLHESKNDEKELFANWVATHVAGAKNR
jgi:hypothetical protein